MSGKSQILILDSKQNCRLVQERALKSLNFPLDVYSGRAERITVNVSVSVQSKLYTAHVRSLSSLSGDFRFDSGLFHHSVICGLYSSLTQVLCSKYFDKLILNFAKLSLKAKDMRVIAISVF